jgi:hypothetical protein
LSLRSWIGPKGGWNEMAAPVEQGGGRRTHRRLKPKAMRRRHVAALGAEEGRRTILLPRRTWALLLEPVACGFTRGRRRRGGLFGHHLRGRQDLMLPTLELTADPLQASGGRARHHHGKEREVRGSGERGGSEEQAAEPEMNRGGRQQRV